MTVLGEDPALRKWNLRLLRKNAVEQRNFIPREAAWARTIRRFAHSGVRDSWAANHPRRQEAMERALAYEKGEVIGSWSGDVIEVGAWGADEPNSPEPEDERELEEGELPDSE